MLHHLRNPPSPRHVFVLTLWQVENRFAGGPAAWRYTLEYGPTGERKGFKNLEALLAYLAAWTQNSPTGSEPVEQ